HPSKPSGAFASVYAEIRIGIRARFRFGVTYDEDDRSRSCIEHPHGSRDERNEHEQGQQQRKEEWPPPHLVQVVSHPAMIPFEQAGDGFQARRTLQTSSPYSRSKQSRVLRFVSGTCECLHDGRDAKVIVAQSRRTLGNLLDLRLQRVKNPLARALSERHELDGGERLVLDPGPSVSLQGISLGNRPDRTRAREQSRIARKLVIDRVIRDRAESA